MFTFAKLTPEMVKIYWPILSELESTFAEKDRWDKNNFLIDLENKWLLSRIILVETEIIGYLITSQKTRDCCHLHKFVISQNFRHKGLGTKIINNYCDLLKPYANFLTLKTHIKHNHYQDFYRRNNFYTIMLVEDYHLFIRCIA